MYYEASRGKDVLMRKRIAGGAPSLEYAGVGATYSGDWSSDGKWILALSNEPPSAALQMRIISVVDKKAVGPLIPGVAPRFSPDGHLFAYCENETGTGSDVFVQPFPPNGSKWQVSTDSGWMPVWRRDGKALYFVTTSGKMMESMVTVSADGGFSAQTPQPLFNVALREGSSIFSQFDVFPDGAFLVNRIPETASTPMTVILHWKEALDR
jgi:Tol biopolymer transport system component